jgi:hypothetical protein
MNLPDRKYLYPDEHCRVTQVKETNLSSCALYLVLTKADHDFSSKYQISIE